MIGLPEIPLLPSDATNLADERIPCPACATLEGEHRADCEHCAGEGTILKPTGRRHLSFSSLSTFLQCEQKYGFTYEDRIEPIEKARPRALGSAFQKAIELGDPQAGVLELREHSSPSADLIAEEATVVGAATAYLERFGQAERSEFQYLVRLRNPRTGAWSLTYDLLGYADGLEDQGAFWELIENKLVGQIQGVQVRKLPLDRQLMLEAYGIWRATGKKVQRVSYRFIRKPSIKPKKGSAKVPPESPEQFYERVLADYRARPEFYIVEEKLLLDDSQLGRIEAELWEWADRIRHARHSNLFPRNSSVCHDYGGCPFLALCLGDPDAASLYRKKPPSKGAR